MLFRLELCGIEPMIVQPVFVNSECLIQNTLHNTLECNLFRSSTAIELTIEVGSGLVEN